LGKGKCLLEKLQNSSSIFGFSKTVKDGDFLFIKKKTIMISLLSALVLWVVCLIVVYNLQPSQVENPSLFGTYQFDIRDIDNTEYIAVIPPSAGDANESEGQFQLYNIDREVLAQGNCKIEKEGFVTFYVDEKSISTIFFIKGKYYFVDDLLEPHEITKTSEEPMISTPLQ